MSNTGPIRKFVAEIRSGLFLVATISLCSNILLLALPIYSLQIFDRVLLSRSIDTFWLLTLGVAVAMLAVAALDWFRGQMLLRISNRLALDFERPLFERVLRQAAMLGERSLQPLRDLQVVRNFIASPQGLPPLIDAPLVPIFLLVVFLMHPWLGAVMGAGIVVLFAMAWLADKGSSALSKAAFAHAQASQHRIDDLVQGNAALVAHGSTRRAYDFWHALQHPSVAHASRSASRSTDFSSAAKAVRLFLNVCMTAVGGYLAMYDQITSGAMIAAVILGSRGLAPVEMLIASSRSMIGAHLSWQRLDTFLSGAADAPRTKLPQPTGELELERVVYAPPGQQRATIKGISFKLKPGTFLGLVGPSAAGKSTLAQLICGVWKPHSGCIRFDGADLQNWDREDRGQAVGYLPQESRLHDATVRENICRFTDCPDEAVVTAAQAAGAHELILRLDNGYETVVGAGGASLSAGQRQRIGLARAFFRNPQLLVLDEPDANLDSEGEDALAKSLGRLKERGATVIVITHRPSVLALADTIGVVVDGQLQQIGPRGDVLKRIQPPGTTANRDVA